MGSCVSSNSKSTRIVHRRVINDNKRKAGGLPETHELPRPSLGFRVGSVLKQPKRINIFEKYRFGKELGRGEFGVTYKCFDDETGEALACKTISKAKLRTEIDVEDVRREVEIMKHLPEHPNIVSFKEAYEDKEAVYLVMELCEGGELFDRIVAKGHYTERAGGWSQ